ncbi:NPC1-like intracellular cholesterol transporter 1 [Clytia hemisphaerica]|uniref:NPC1-like intracellular cholesterol transporter 1 n=1 Tax=Clytia hemisphaerica TaxID=252671 RepID=UPI0034D67872
MAPQFNDSVAMPTTPEHAPQQQNGVKVVNSKEQEKSESDGCCKNFTNKINAGLENFFASVGLKVAMNPVKVILISLLVSFLCIAGITELEEENRGEKNWVSQSSDPIKHKEWIDDVFPLATRSSGLLLESTGQSNLLTRDGLIKLYEVDQKVRLMHNGTDKLQWNDICYTPGGSVCIPSSVLELWSYNLTLISSLTETDIKNTINTPGVVSPMTGRSIVMERIIGGPVQRDSTGNITGAPVLKVDYRLKKQDVFDKATGRNVDELANTWEEELEKTFQNNAPSGFNVYTFSLWSNNEASRNASSGDLKFFVFGYIMVIIYLSIMLGSFSRIDHKIFLALSGIGIIGISIGIAYGLGSAFQLKYTSVHNVLPFLMLGIGVDDIFVIVQSWYNVGGPNPDDRPIPEKVSLAMRHAGVSVLVTSVTDICAFAIGAATILPALRSFSIWCAIGILAIFLLTITLFTALLTLDAKRQRNRRDACLCCLKLSEDYEPFRCSESNILTDVLKKLYAPMILSVPGKVIVLTIVVGLLGAGCYGLTELEQNFDFIWFLPSDSRPRMFVEKDRIAFPGNGIPGNVYIGQIDYYNSKEQLDKMKRVLESDDYISQGTMNSWFHHYEEWLVGNYINELTPVNCTIETCKLPNEARFYQLLNVFLTTKDGGNYRRMMVFNNDNKIRASKIGYSHKQLVGSKEQVKAMDSITEIIKPGFMSDGGEEVLPFAFSQRYINWSTNKVIGIELIRNLSLAGGCVLIVTLFLLSNFLASLMVVACVAFSLVRVFYVP